MNIKIFIYLFFIFLFFSFILFSSINYCESFYDIDIKCPPRDKNGYIQCPDIEDPVLKKLHCDAIQNHCQVKINQFS